MPKRTQRARRAFVGGSPVSCLSASLQEGLSAGVCACGRIATRLRLISFGRVDVSTASSNDVRVVGHCLGLTRCRDASQEMASEDRAEVTCLRKAARMSGFTCMNSVGGQRVQE